MLIPLPEISPVDLFASSCAVLVIRAWAGLVCLTGNFCFELSDIRFKSVSKKTQRGFSLFCRRWFVTRSGWIIHFQLPFVSAKFNQVLDYVYCRQNGALKKPCPLSMDIKPIKIPWFRGNKIKSSWLQLLSPLMSLLNRQRKNIRECHTGN